MKKQVSLIILLIIASFSYAQKMKVQEGNIKNLKDINQYSLVFDYSDLEIPKFKNEAEFLKDKMEKREKKEAGSGEEFKKNWFNDREERYQPKFIESFNKRFKNNEITVTDNDTSNYIMHIHTTKIYPGYNVGIMRHNAEISVTISVYSKANPDKILFKGSYKDVQGAGAMGYDYNSGYRISECYAKSAKIFAKYIQKKAL